MSAIGIRAILDENAVVGPMRAGAKRFWTGREVKIVRDHYSAGGVPACLPLLPGRTASSIYQRAGLLGLKSPATVARRGVPRERWAASAAIDAVIRRAYQRTPAKNDILKCAQAVGRPRWWVSRRAATLGLVTPRFRAPAWTPAEDAIVEASPHSSSKVLRRRLKIAGYERTETAITVRLKRLGASREDPNRYTARGLATLMGVDSHAVAAWIAKGWLRAKRRGTARVAVQGGDEWWIKHADVRAFVVDNVGAVDIRKVDKWWLVDLLAAPMRRDGSQPRNGMNQNTSPRQTGEG